MFPGWLEHKPFSSGYVCGRQSHLWVDQQRGGPRKLGRLDPGLSAKQHVERSESLGLLHRGGISKSYCCQKFAPVLVIFCDPFGNDATRGQVEPLSDSVAPFVDGW